MPTAYVYTSMHAHDNLREKTKNIKTDTQRDPRNVNDHLQLHTGDQSGTNCVELQSGLQRVEVASVSKF